MTDVEPSFLNASQLKWWGEFHFEIGQSRAWRLGSLLIRITRNLNEWQLEYHRPRSQNEDDQDWDILDPESDFGQKTILERYLYAQTSDTLTLLPRLADRSAAVGAPSARMAPIPTRWVSAAVTAGLGVVEQAASHREPRTRGRRVRFMEGLSRGTDKKG